MTLSVSTAVAPDLTARSMSLSLFTPKNLFVVQWNEFGVVIVGVDNGRNEGD